MKNEKYVQNRWGVVVPYNVAETLMDEEIMEELNEELAPCSNQKFFDAYAAAHELKFGETWELDKPNPVY